MAAEIVAVADAVVAAVNGQSFTAPYQSLQATMLYVPEYDLKDLDALKVTVVPRGLAGQPADRARTREMGYEIDLGFQKRVPGLAKADIDGLAALVQEVADYLFRNPLAVATPIGLVNDPVYEPDRLRQMQEFLSVLTVTYRTWR